MSYRDIAEQTGSADRHGNVAIGAAKGYLRETPLPRDTTQWVIGNCHGLQLTRTLLALGRRELAPEDAVALDSHVASCPACSSLAKSSQALDSAISRAMLNVTVPAGLHEQLLQSAFARRGAALRRTVYRYSALAALVLVGVGLVFGGYWRSRPTLDTEALAYISEQELEQREQTVRDWLVAGNLPTKLPYDFDFRLCVFHGKQEISGREVPVVLFASGRDTARVLFIRKSQFKTDDARFAKSSLCTVEVHTNLHADYVVLITYTTERPDPFLIRRAPQIVG